MRRSQRLIAATVLISLSGALAGCSGGIGNFDPTDMLDWLDTKKKLPGDRKPVFPEGVPGLEQGVPRDLYKGSAQERLDEQKAREAAAAAAVPAAEPKSKQAAKSKAKGKPPETAGTPAEEPAAAAEEEGGTAEAPPAPKPKKIVRKRTTAPPPDQQATQPAPAPGQPQQQSASPFPAPLPGGTLTR